MCGNGWLEYRDIKKTVNPSCIYVAIKIRLVPKEHGGIPLDEEFSSHMCVINDLICCIIQFNTRIIKKDACKVAWLEDI